MSFEKQPEVKDAADAAVAGPRTLLGDALGAMEEYQQQVADAARLQAARDRAALAALKRTDVARAAKATVPDVNLVRGIAASIKARSEVLTTATKSIAAALQEFAARRPDRE